MVWAIPFVVISLFSVIFGLLIYLRPQLTIEAQERFYAKINWRIEPISVSREVRNTKIMGLSLIVFVVLAWVITLVAM